MADSDPRLQPLLLGKRRKIAVVSSEISSALQALEEPGATVAPLGEVPANDGGITSATIKRMGTEVKTQYRLFRRSNGIYFYEDRETRKQASLKTRNLDEAQRLLQAHNDAKGVRGINSQIGRIYLAADDPDLPKRTWRYVAEQIIKTRHGANAHRWQTAIKDKALAKILDLPLIETKSDHFLAALNSGTVSTNVFLRRLHNHAVGYGWLPAPVLPPKSWPKVKHAPKRGITQAEQEKIIAREGNAERRAFYQLLWELGGSQSDIAGLTNNDIDWKTKTLSYFRRKNDQPAKIRFDEEVDAILRQLPSQGPLFPYLRRVRCSDRATEFKQRCRGLGIEGVTLHSYRYSWAERARDAGYPERAAQEVLGHGSKAVHRAYARQANPELVTIGAWQKRQAANNLIPLEIKRVPVLGDGVTTVGNN